MAFFKVFVGSPVVVTVVSAGRMVPPRMPIAVFFDMSRF